MGLEYMVLDKCMGGPKQVLDVDVNILMYKSYKSCMKGTGLLFFIL